MQVSRTAVETSRRTCFGATQIPNAASQPSRVHTRTQRGPTRPRYLLFWGSMVMPRRISPHPISLREGDACEQPARAECGRARVHVRAQEERTASVYRPAG